MAWIKREFVEQTQKKILMKTGLDYRYPNGNPSIEVTKEKALQLFDHYFVELEKETDDYILIHGFSENDMF